MGFQIGIKDIIDIVLVAILLHQLFLLLKRSGALSLFLGVISFLAVWFLVSYVFKMELLGGIFDRVVSVGTFALIVLFQDEIKRLFSKVGSQRKWALNAMLKRVFGNEEKSSEESEYNIVQIVLACRNLSIRSEGALIVLERKDDLNNHALTGEIIDANINSRLIENLFFKNSPLHDGAMIIREERIHAVSCILPVSKKQQIPKRLGLRHRSAIAISEQSDAIGIVVSEETGKISYTFGGKLTQNVKPEELEMFLSKNLYSYK